jgi:hypothetical protein
MGVYTPPPDLERELFWASALCLLTLWWWVQLWWRDMRERYLTPGGFAAPIPRKGFWYYRPRAHLTAVRCLPDYEYLYQAWLHSPSRAHVRRTLEWWGVGKLTPAGSSFRPDLANALWRVKCALNRMSRPA